MKKNVVVVYGSGASYASGYEVEIKFFVNDEDRTFVLKPPTDGNFFELVSRDYIDYGYKALSNFLTLYYPKIMHNKLSLEKVWTDIDINHKQITLDTYGWIHENSDYINNARDGYLNMNLMRVYFDGEFFNTNSRYDKYKFFGDCGRDFRRLVYEIYANYKLPNGQDNFDLMHDLLSKGKYTNISYITFNYDCFLEQSLANKDLKLKYISMNDATNNYSSLLYDGVPIIKLHGSLNWEEQRNGWIYRIEFKPLPYECQLQVRPDYNEDLQWSQPAIIPPTMMKQEINDDSRLGNDLTKTILQQWRAAITLLAEADLVIFVGYSFPVADHHAERIFRISNLIKKRQNGGSPIVINCCGPTDDESNKRKKMQDLFGEESRINVIKGFEVMLKSEEFLEIIR